MDRYSCVCHVYKNVWENNPQNVSRDYLWMGGFINKFYFLLMFFCCSKISTMNMDYFYNR